MKSKSRGISMKKTGKSKSRSRLGGAAIAAGGYGCVFKPALKCKGSVSRTSGVTKVLLNRYADDEINEITKVKRIIELIPNYNDYFLGLDAVKCDLDTLTPDDKVGFDTKCGNLTKHSIRSTNVNMNLTKIKGINLPYGGLEFKNFFIDKNLTPDTFVNVNNAMIKLLKNGLSPMNKLKLFHFDLKGPNILISDDYKARIIDWGLSGSQSANEVPGVIKTRPFMYNAPFSICVFDHAFKAYIKQTISGILNNIGHIHSLNEIRSDIKLYMIKWIYKFMNKGGRGHYDYLNYLFNNLIFISYELFPGKTTIDTNPDLTPIINYSFINEFISDELTDVVIQYTNLDGDFNDERFFNNAFKHNVDIWGLLTCYIDDLIHILINNPINKLTKKQSNELLYGIRQLANKYMFNGKQLVNPISVDILARDLKELNSIFGHARTPSPIAHVSVPIHAPVPAPGISIPSSRVPSVGPRAIAFSSSKSKSKTRSRSPVVPVGPAPKKTRKRNVVCDDEKKRKCAAMGKVCKEETGRCNKA
jgi:hypothetical protein